MDAPTTQLLVTRFAAGGEFEGGLLGALERLEADGSCRVLDVLFARRNAESGELDVLVAGDDSAGRMAAAVIEFRLDESSRRKRSAAALEANPELAQLADALELGAALGAVLLERRGQADLADLADAIERAGGQTVRSELTDASSLRELLPQVMDASRG
jgi:hypothetical protein